MKRISHEIKCIQPTDPRVFTESQLRNIAALIYQTDPFIYPAMFRSQENAELLIPELILRGDEMFCAENLFLAVAEEKIVGIILWHKGPLDWSPELLKECESSRGIEQSPHLTLAKEQYFSSYNTAPEDRISILNVCTSSECRNFGIGSILLRSFIEEHRDCREFELYVLADNLRAIHLYEKYGFSSVECLQGFSIDDRDLPCLRMIRAI